MFFMYEYTIMYHLLYDTLLKIKKKEYLPWKLSYKTPHSNWKKHKKEKFTIKLSWKNKTL